MILVLEPSLSLVLYSGPVKVLVCLDLTFDVECTFMHFRYN